MKQVKFVKRNDKDEQQTYLPWFTSNSQLGKELHLQELLGERVLARLDFGILPCLGGLSKLGWLITETLGDFFTNREVKVKSRRDIESVEFCGKSIFLNEISFIYILNKYLLRNLC